MLDLDVLVRRLTQGRPHAEMTLAAPPSTLEEAQPAPAVSGGSEAAATARIAEGATEVDVHTLARRVYELFCRDAAERNGRMGGRR